MTYFRLGILGAKKPGFFSTWRCSYSIVKYRFVINLHNLKIRIKANRIITNNKLFSNGVIK